MSVEVILLEKIEKLGSLGDVVKVKPGYARNYLLPMGKALRANEANKMKFESERKQLEAAQASIKQQAETAAKKIDGVMVKLVRAASETGQLFGSVNVRDIAEALAEQGHQVKRHMIMVPMPIKQIGDHEVKCRFHADVVATIKLQVVKNVEDLMVVDAILTKEQKKALKAEQIAKEKSEKKAAQEKTKMAKMKMANEQATDAKDEPMAKTPKMTAAVKKTKTTKKAQKK